MLYNKIIVGYNGSKACDHALVKSIKLAEKFNSKVEIVNVIEYSYQMLSNVNSYSGFPVIFFEESQIQRKEFMQTRKQNILDKIKELNTNVDVEILILEGEPAQVIKERVQENVTNLLVLGHSTKTGVEKILIGSTASYFARNIKTDILIVK